MKSWVIFLVFLFVSFPVFSEVCTYERLRVSKYSKIDGIPYYSLNNLDYRFIIGIDEKYLGSDLAKKLNASDNDSALFLNITLNHACKAEIYFLNRITPGEVKNINSTTTLNTLTNPECIKLKSPPVQVDLPPISSMKKILDQAAGFSPEKVEMTTNMIIRLFSRMNPKTTSANTLALMVSLFRAFDLLGVDTISNEQLKYLTATFKDFLPSSQYKLVEAIFSQIHSLAFSKTAAGDTMLTLNNIGNKSIILTGKDFPVPNEEVRKALEKYFQKLEFHHGASMVFKESKEIESNLKKEKNQMLTSFEIKTISRPTIVTVSGIEITATNIPMFGNINISPTALDVDIDQKAPVGAKVKFKKGPFSYSHTFELDETYR